MAKKVFVFKYGHGLCCKIHIGPKTLGNKYRKKCKICLVAIIHRYTSYKLFTLSKANLTIKLLSILFPSPTHQVIIKEQPTQLRHTLPPGVSHLNK